MSAEPLPDNRNSLQPNRTYEVPGGPYARDLDEVDVKVLAKIQRGGRDDAGFGQRR